jgi:tetratricopeptide (TPR) repeat protein
MSGPEPIATGTLAKTPLPHLLVYLDQKKLSGTLAIWPDEIDPQGTSKPDRILLLKGCPVAASLGLPATALREGLLALFTRTRAPYAFYGANLLGDNRLSARVDPLSLIAESLRGFARDDVVSDVLQRLGTSKLRLQPGADLARYDLQPDERLLIELLQAKPGTIEEIVDAVVAESQMTPVHGHRLIYLLAITKAVESVGEPVQPRDPEYALQNEDIELEPETMAETPSTPPPLVSSPAEPPPARPGSMPPLHSSLDELQSIPQPPEGISEELRQRWLRIVTKGRLIENQNFFEMLDLDKDVKSADARAKYFQIAKEWHPDRLPPELAPLREFVQIIFSYMSDANVTLGDDVQRAKYLQTVREGGGTPATDRLMQAILDTAMEYERVLVMARRHQHDDALALMHKILHVVKEDPEYHAMYASLLMQKHANKDQDAPLKQMLESVDRALSLYPRHEKANLLKGQILRRMGKQSEALSFFKRAAEINPRNIDAMREVRVATMRAASAPVKRKGAKEDTGVSGLLGKIFKKD